jgi:cytoskeletal protein CcmA (bactofilin family)
MFNAANSKKEKSSSAQQGIMNFIGTGTEVKGDLSSNGDIRVDGSIEGTVRVQQRLVVGDSGKIAGDIHALHATIAGYIKGNVSVKKTLILKPNSKIDGDIITDQLIIESGAQFNGRCTMNVQKTVNPASAPASHATTKG